MARKVGVAQRSIKRIQKYVVIFVTLAYDAVIATQQRPTMKAYALFFAIVTLALAYVASQALNAGAAALLLR